MGNHWYHTDGTPQHTVVGKNGKTRDTTLLDARSMGLLPSVTSCIGILAKRGIEEWKMNSICEFADMFPRKAGEALADWQARVQLEFSNYSGKAAEFGTEMHRIIESVNANRFNAPPAFSSVIKDDLMPWAAQYIAWVKAQCLMSPEPIIETTIANKYIGVAGCIDLLAYTNDYGWVLFDFKTQAVKKEEPALYDEWVWQLGLYAGMVQKSDLIGGCLPRVASVVIDSTKIVAPKMCLWTEAEQRWGFEVGKSCVDLFYKTRRYDKP